MTHLGRQGWCNREVPRAPPGWESGNYSGSTPGLFSRLELQTPIHRGSDNTGLRRRWETSGAPDTVLKTSFGASSHKSYSWNLVAECGLRCSDALEGGQIGCWDERDFSSGGGRCIVLYEKKDTNEIKINRGQANRSVNKMFSLTELCMHDSYHALWKTSNRLLKNSNTPDYLNRYNNCFL